MKVKPQGICIKTPLLKATKRKAKRLGRSWSRHVCMVLEADLKNEENKHAN